MLVFSLLQMQSQPVRARRDQSGLRSLCISAGTCVLEVECTLSQTQMYSNLVFLFVPISSPTLSFTFLVTQPPAPLSLSCHKFVNETTGNIAFVVTWEIKSENLERTLEAIDHYDVIITKGTNFTEGHPLISQSIVRTISCIDNLFSSRTREGYNVRFAYKNSGDLQVIGLLPVNDPNIGYHFKVSVFLVLQKLSLCPIFLFFSCLLSKARPCSGGTFPANKSVLLILCQSLQLQLT